MELNALTALSPIDGRYARQTDALRGIFSEYAFMNARVRVEVEWLIALSEAGFEELPRISESGQAFLRGLYENFSLDVKGKYVLKVCRGTACHVRKSGNVLQALYDATGLSESKPTSDDGLFTIEIVSCLGACGLSPVVMVNDTVHPAMTPDKAVDLIEELREKEGA